MYAKAYLEPTRTSMVELLCENKKKNFIVDVRLGSKYASCIGFTVEKVYRMSIFTWYGQSRLRKFVIVFLFLELIKSMLIKLFMMEVSIIKKPVHWFAMQMNGLGSMCNLLSSFLLLLTSWIHSDFWIKTQQVEWE